ncbi:cytochrome c oxidase subunit CcoM [Pseudomonas sp. ML96]|nr:cytochrome c oxidase subunit CcoM [Pseudomonas sp. ML96]
MFLDTVVIAGIGTVALMVAFFGGVGYFIWKDSHKPAKAAVKAE